MQPIVSTVTATQVGLSLRVSVTANEAGEVKCTALNKTDPAITNPSAVGDDPLETEADALSPGTTTLDIPLVFSGIKVAYCTFEDDGGNKADVVASNDVEFGSWSQLVLRRCHRYGVIDQCLRVRPMWFCLPPTRRRPARAVCSILFPAVFYPCVHRLHVQRRGEAALRRGGQRCGRGPAFGHRRPEQRRGCRRWLRDGVVWLHRHLRHACRCVRPG